MNSQYNQRGIRSIKGKNISIIQEDNPDTIRNEHDLKLLINRMENGMKNISKLGTL